MSDYSLLTTLTGSNGNFGSTASVSFDYLVVGIPNYSSNDPLDPEPISNVGLAIVYKTSDNGATWSQHDELKSPEYESGNPVSDQNFGNSVSISESIIAVGESNATVNGNTGSGKVYIYKIDTNTTEWTLSKTFSDADKMSGGGADFNFGSSVSVSGSYLIVGEPGDHNSANKGRITIYKTSDNGTTWSYLMDYSGQSNDLIGTSVHINGQYAIASGLGTSTNYGVACIFYQNTGGSDSWGLQKRITSVLSSYTGFGSSVSLYGDYAVIGEEDGNSGTGQAIVYYKDQGGTDNWGSVKTLTASDGASGDKFGNSVAIFEDVIIVGAYKDDTSPYTDNGSAYVYVTTDNWGTVTENKIAAENPATDGNFSSNTVSLSSKYIIVGYEKYNSDSGAVGVYKIPKQYYSTLNKLLPDDNTSVNAYGVSTAIYGDTIVVGSVVDNGGKGAAYVYTYSGGSYTRTKLTPSDGEGGDQFGISVSIDKNYIAVGAYKDDSTGFTDHGSVYIFEKSGSTWPSTETQKIVTNPLVASDQLGGCVAIKDNYVVIGRGPFSGSGTSTTTKEVSVWYRDPSDSTWKSFQTITASDEANDDHFGESVSIDNDYIVVGAGTDDDTATDSGSAYIYYKPTNYWIQLDKIQASTPNASYYFGRNVKIYGHTIAISEIANLSNSSTNQGYVYIFDSSDGGLSWTQTTKITGPIAGERFGGDIALYGNYLLVGSRLGDLTENNVGYSYIYYKDEGGSNNWGLKKKIVNYGSVLSDYSGYAVALSGSTGVITTYYDDDIGDRSGGAYTINVEEETVSDPNLSNCHVIFVQDVGTNNTYVDFSTYDGTTIKLMFTVGSTQYSEDIDADNYTNKDNFFTAVVNAMNTAYGSTNFSFDTVNNKITSSVAYTFNLRSMNADLSNTIVGSTSDISSLVRYNLSINTSFTSYDATTNNKVIIFTVESTQYSGNIVSSNYTDKDNFFNAVVNAMNTAYGSTNFGFDNNKITSIVAYTFNFGSMNADLSNTIVGSTSDITPVSYDININTSFTSYDANKNKVIFNVGGTEYSENILSLNYTLKNDFFTAVVNAMNTAYGSTNFSFDTDNNKITSSVAYTFNLGSMNADLSNTIVGSTSDITPTSPYDLSMKEYTELKTQYETNKGSFLSYYNDLTKFVTGKGLLASGSSFFSYSLNTNWYNRTLNRINTIRINIKVPTYSASSNIRTNGSVTYFTLNSTASSDGWTMTTYYADNENGVGSIDIILVAPIIPYDLSINTSFASYDATKNKVIFTVGGTEYSGNIVAQNYTDKDDFFNAVVNAMNTAYGSTNFGFDNINNKITSSVAYTFNLGSMNAYLSNTIVGSTSNITPTSPYNLNINTSFTSYDATKNKVIFTVGSTQYSGNIVSSNYTDKDNFFNAVVNAMNTAYGSTNFSFDTDNNKITSSVVYTFNLGSMNADLSNTIVGFTSDIEPPNAWEPTGTDRDTYNLIDFDITATNAKKLEHLFKDSFWKTDPTGATTGLNVTVSLKDSSFVFEDVIFKYEYDAVNIYTFREPCKVSEKPETGILGDNSKVSKNGTVLYTGDYEDGDFPTPLVCYSDAIVYGTGSGSYPTGIDGTGVFLVAQFDEYPYDPFATLLPDTTWLQMFVKQSSKDTSKWIVSFHARMDIVYDISNAKTDPVDETISSYYKIADFVPSTGITMSGVLSSISNIRWGFYGTDGTTAYYFSPIYGTYNYINDQNSDSVSSSGITILSSPSKSSTVTSGTQHQNVCSFGTRLASNFSFNKTYNYGSPISLYTTDGVSNRLSIYNPLRYNGLRSSTRMFPFTNDQDSDYGIDVSLQYIKKIEIKSKLFDPNITSYFTNIRSGWSYTQTQTGTSPAIITTLTFEYTDNGYGYDASDYYLDNIQLAVVNVTGSDLTNFIGNLSTPLNDIGNKVTYTVYYTNNNLNSDSDAVDVTINSETYKTVSDDFHNNYYYSQEGYDGVFQLRLKESHPSTDSINSNLNLILTERGSVKEVRKSSDTSTKTSEYATSTPSTESDPPAVIDVTERFGKHIHMFIRNSGRLYVRNGHKYYDNTSMFDYKPYDTEYNAPTWTGLKSFSMASTLFNSSITYFTDIQSGWSYSQTGTSPATVTLTFTYTADVTNGVDLSAISGDSVNGEPIGIYVGKPNINVDIISGIMRTPYTVSGPNIVYTYNYTGSDGSVTQTGYDGVFGITVESGQETDSQESLYAYDSEKNLIDEQGSIVTASAADPHVMPITGEPYDLPHEDRTFLLYYNNNSEYPMSIKGKCWHLPESKYKRNIDRLHQIGYHERADKYLKLFENNTYFRYIEFVCGHEQLIIDMESLWYCSMTTVEDVDNFSLPHLPSYDNNQFISITDFAHSKTGIITVRPPNKTTLERTVTMNGPDTIIQLKLMIDSRDITNRNGIIIKVRGPVDEHVGALVRKSIIYSDFSEKLNVLVVPNHLLTKKLFNNKTYTASSYGATKEEYEYNQLDIFTTCPINIPNKDKTYLLYSNNDINYPITIKTKCWYVPEEKYLNKLNKIRDVGYNERAQKYEKIFKKHTFMRYVEFVCCEESVIIDMESLWYYSGLCMQDVNNFDLTRLEGYKSNKHISITDFEHSKTGINVKRAPNKTTMQRIVTLRGKNIVIEARLILDRRSITERNNMEVKIMGLKDHHNGLLIDNDVIETQFSFKRVVNNNFKINENITTQRSEMLKINA